ncbi:MAG: hypothetical protein CMD83_05205 [Gammaproteobacteria bacterium]|nr:hypothetical protein [Gammaproteobacteria bacterium]
MAYLSSFDAESPASHVATQLLSQGGVVIDALVPPELMDSVRAEIRSNVDEADEQGSSVLWPEGNRTVGGLAAVSSTFVEELLVHPKILEVVDRVLQPQQPMILPRGERDAPLPVTSEKLDDGGTQLVWRSEGAQAHCHHYNVGAAVMLEIGAGRQDHQYLHRENAIYQPFIERIGMPEFIVSTMWAGTDFTPQNGATRVVPGSHKWPEALVAQSTEIAQAVMRKGSVVLWLSRTLHGAAKSTSDRERTGYFASYIVDWLRQEENQYIVVPEDAARSLSKRARQLIGYRSSPSLGWAKGRDADNLLDPGQSGQL